MCKIYIFFRLHSYHLQLITFLNFKVLFSLFMYINGEGPGILSVFSYLTNEFTYMLSVTIFQIHRLSSLTTNFVPYQQGYHWHTAPFLPPTLPLKKVKEKPKLSLGNFNLFFSFLFSWTRWSTESSSSWTGWLYQGLGRVLQKNGYVLHFLYYFFGLSLINF